MLERLSGLLCRSAEQQKSALIKLMGDLGSLDNAQITEFGLDLVEKQREGWKVFTGTIPGSSIEISRKLPIGDVIEAVFQTQMARGKFLMGELVKRIEKGEINLDAIISSK